MFGIFEKSTGLQQVALLQLRGEYRSAERHVVAALVLGDLRRRGGDARGQAVDLLDADPGLLLEVRDGRLPHPAGVVHHHDLVAGDRRRRSCRRARRGRARPPRASPRGGTGCAASSLRRARATAVRATWLTSFLRASCRMGNTGCRFYHSTWVAQRRLRLRETSPRRSPAGRCARPSACRARALGIDLGDRDASSAPGGGPASSVPSASTTSAAPSHSLPRSARQRSASTRCMRLTCAVAIATTTSRCGRPACAGEALRLLGAARMSAPRTARSRAAGNQRS